MKFPCRPTLLHLLLLIVVVGTLSFSSIFAVAQATTTSNTSKPAYVWPTSIPVVDLDEENGVASVQISLQFSAAQYRTWLSTASVQIAGSSPLYDQPFGVQATFGGTLLVSQVKLINDVTLNVTIKANKCFVPNADDHLLVRFGGATTAVRIRDPSTLSTSDVTGDEVPESSVLVVAESVEGTRTAGLGLVAFTFALICLLFLLSDWTQATVSCMQLQWVVMLSMQTCVPLATSGIVQNAHWVLWPLNGRLAANNPEYAFRMLFNLLVMLFVLVLEVVMIGAFMAVGRDRITAMQRVRFPSTLGVAMALLLPSGCMYSSTQVFSLLDAGASVAGGPQVTYAVVSLLLAVIYLALICVATFTVVSRLVYRDLQPRANRTWFSRLTSPDGEWLVEDAVSARWGLLFDSYSVRGFWVFAALQIITFLFAVASGPAPTTRAGCSAKAYVNVVTAVILAALHVVRKPFNSAMANLTNTIVALAIVVLCVANASANSDSCSSKSRVFSSACSWAALLVLCVKVLAHCMLTGFSSVNKLLFAAEQRAAAAATAGYGGEVEDTTADVNLGGRLITPFGNSSSSVGDDQKQTIPLDANDAFELKLFHGAENMDASGSAAAAAAGSLSHLVGVASGSSSAPEDDGTTAAAGITRSVVLGSPSSSSSSPRHGGGVNIAGLRPVLGNPVMVAGAFLRREIGFGKMGGLRGSTGPSLVIQLHAPVCCAVTSAGVVIVVEAGFRGAGLGRNRVSGATNAAAAGGGDASGAAANNTTSGASTIPKDAKPRVLAHAPDSRRTEEIQLRDAALLRDAFSGGGGGGARRRRGSSSRAGGDDDQQSTGDSPSDSPTKRQQQQQSSPSSSQSKSLLKLPSACCAGQACLFVCDADEGSVIRIDLVSGLVSTVISDLLKPSGVAVFGDVLYVSDTLRHRVLAVDLLAGKVSVFCGTGAAGFDADGTSASQSRLNCPHGIFVCSDTAELFICDSCNHRVVCVPLSLRTVRTVIGVAGVIGGGTGSAAANIFVESSNRINNSSSSGGGGGLQPAKEIALAMPTQVIARVAPAAQLLDASAVSVELFVVESGASRIWHVSRFGFAHVVLPPNEYVMPHAMCLAPAPARFQSSAQAFVLPATHHEGDDATTIGRSINSSSSSHHSALYSPQQQSSVELLVVDTVLQIVARVSIPSLQPAVAAERVPEFQFALLPPPRARRQSGTEVAPNNSTTVGMVSLSDAMSPIERRTQNDDIDAATLATL